MRTDTIAKLARLLAPAMGWLRSHMGLCITVVAFVGMSGLYAQQTPFFEMPGETWHLRRILTQRGSSLPPGLTFLEEQQAAPQADLQPPLYYSLGALLVAPLEVSADTALYEPNPYADMGQPEDPGNRNIVMVKVPPAPNSPLARAILRLRYLSIAAATASLPLVYLSFLRLTRGKVSLSSAAVAVLAFSPGLVYLLSGISNRALGFFWCMLTVYLCLRMADTRHPSTLLRWSAALAAGLAMLTTWWGLGAVLLVAITLALCAQRVHLDRHAALRLFAPQLAALLAPTLGMLVWLALQRANATSPGLWAHLAALTPLARMQLALQSYWGLFGWLNVPANPLYYTVIAILMVLCVAGLALQILRTRWVRGASASGRARLELAHPRYTVALAWMALSLAALVGSALSPEVLFVGAALLPLAPGLALLLALGLQYWARERYKPALLAALALALAGATVLAPFAYIAPAYAAPAPLDLDELPIDLRPLDVALGSELFLLGYRMDDAAMEPDGILRLELYWLARARMSHDYIAHVTVLGRDDTLVANHMGYVGGGARPTSLWAPGDVVVDKLTLHVAEDTEAPTAADVRLSVYAEPGGEPIAAVDPHGNPLGGNFRLTQARLAAPQRVRYVPEHPMEANLDNEISLVGYGFAPQRPKPGEEWEIILYWRSEGPLIHDYTVFIHLVDPYGEMITQVDSPPLQGNYPTSFWAMGEQVRDVHYMHIPENLPPGEYRLRVGLYRLETGERLILLDSDPPQDYISIGPINIP